MTTFQSDRLGSLHVPEQEHIEFSRGLLGFEHLKRFVHVEFENEFPLGWLQSLEDPGTAFVVANPALFFPHYRLEVDPRELGDVRPSPNEKLLVLGICTLADGPRGITMNLQGPLVINQASRKGKQLVLSHSHYVTQHPLTEHSTAHSAPRLSLPEPPRRTVRA